MGRGSLKQSGLLAVIVEFTLLAMLMAAVPLIVALDVLVLEHGVQEISVTEFSQAGLIFFSVVLMGSAARNHPDSRAVLTLVTGFLGAKLIRELDWIFDDLLPGSWLIPALVVGVAMVVYAVRHRGEGIAALVRFAGTKPFAYLVIGLLLTLAFSRVFGTGQLWSAIMGDDYRKLYKSVIQEGLELLGYLLVFFGSVLTYLQERNSRS